LYDMILIKDNHILAAGSLENAVSRAVHDAPHPLRIEVEVESLDMAKQAVRAGADGLLCDPGVAGGHHRLKDG